MRASVLIVVALWVLSSRAYAEPPPMTSVDVQLVEGSDDWVVFLHGLARSGKSMRRIATAFRGAGYNTCVIDYPSTDLPISRLASEAIAPEIRRCMPAGRPVNVVTHSMGGILVRQMVHDKLMPDIGRVVMLSPPNHGSEVVDRMGSWAPFEWLNGPAGSELGTSVDSLPNALGPVTFETGVITGRRTINWVLSMMIEGPDDGKVSVESAKVDGMRDFRVIGATHPFIMKKPEAIELALRFMQKGSFSESPQPE